MSIVPLIIQLLTGAVGGNLAGRILKKVDLGTLWNSVVGIIGGGLGGQILGQLGIDAGPSGSLNPADIIGSLASGGTGGGVLLIIIGLIKSAMGKK